MQASAVDISEGEGFASKVYKATLSLTGAAAPEYSVIMKVPTKECMEKAFKGASTDDGKVECCR